MGGRGGVIHLSIIRRGKTDMGKYLTNRHRSSYCTVTNEIGAGKIVCVYSHKLLACWFYAKNILNLLTNIGLWTRICRHMHMTTN